jgi:hypothetical protein
MSHLREITKRLGERSAAAQQADHLAACGQRLQACSAALPQYEWIWREQHLEALELSQPEIRHHWGIEAEKASGEH